MTPDLIVRFREESPPFDGWTIESEMIDFGDILPRLKQVVEVLRATDPLDTLSWFKDWCFHDGVPSHPLPFAWSDLDTMTAAEDAAAQLCVGDDLCARAIYPASMAWLFRIDVPELEGTFKSPSVWQGRFDLTGPLGLVRKVADALTPLPLSFQPAARFFIPSWEREWPA